MKTIPLFIVAFAPAIFAATYYASPNGAADAACTADNPGSIAAALALTAGADSWETGDTVVFQDGRYAIPTAGHKVTYSVDKPFLTLRSASEDPTQTLFIGGYTNAPGSAFKITGPARVEGIAFTNFASCNSGFVMTCVSTENGGVTVSNCLFQNNLGYTAGSTKSRYAAGYGGDYIDCRFVANTNNEYSLGGACIARGSACGCTFLRNRANQGGAIIDTCATNCLFEGNHAAYTLAAGGAALFTKGVRGSLVNCAFLTNSCAGQGGAVAGIGDCFAENCVFIGNSGPKVGGALQGFSSANCRFEGNAGGGGGGGIISGGSHTNAVIVGNSAYQGLASGTYFDSLIVSNSGYYCFHTFSAIRCRIEGNTSDYHHFYSVGRLVDCLVVSNTVSRDRPFSAPVAVNCTFVGNKVGKSFFAVSGGATTNCLFYGNMANASAGDLAGGTHVAALYQGAKAAATLERGCRQISEPPFEGARRPEAFYMPARRSPAVDTGVAVDFGMDGDRDFYGRRRLNGTALDIGCAERWPLHPATLIRLQ